MKISSFGGKNWISSPNSCKILGIDERKFEFAVFFMSFNRGRTSKCVSKIWKKHQSFVLSILTITYIVEVQMNIFIQEHMCMKFINWFLQQYLLVHLKNISGMHINITYIRVLLCLNWRIYVRLSIYQISFK